MNSPDPTPHLERFDTYEQACQQFSWVIPKRFNIASEICRRHADAVTRIALGDVKEGAINTYTFGGLDFLSDKFATALSTSGVRQGDSVAVALPPSAALIVAHLGALKAGTVVATIPSIYHAALIELALRDSNARAIVIDESSFDRVERFAQKLPDLDSRFVVRDLRSAVTSTQVKDFWAEIDRASSQFEAVETDASSAAFIFYIDRQGETTGLLHSHRSAIAQLAAFEVLFDVQSGGARGTAGDWSPSV
ncbi:MAG TPA: AMP-binding protein, partial [Blastocatellia bacterium]|nr:AMP-binding protein [Blastocatellia bacterium]